MPTSYPYNYRGQSAITTSRPPRAPKRNSTNNCSGQRPLSEQRLCYPLCTGMRPPASRHAFDARSVSGSNRKAATTTQLGASRRKNARSAWGIRTSGATPQTTNNAAIAAAAWSDAKHATMTKGSPASDLAHRYEAHVKLPEPARPCGKTVSATATYQTRASAIHRVGEYAAHTGLGSEMPCCSPESSDPTQKPTTRLMST